MASVESVNPVVAADYLLAYTERYRTEYGRFTTAPPEGSGYPALSTSPYVDGELLTCYLAADGYAIADESRAPEDRWDIAGGPAFLIDVEPSKVPVEITQMLEVQGLRGKNIGIYRIVAKQPLTPDEWSGVLPTPTATEERSAGKLRIVVSSYDITWADLISRLTFGAFGKILDLHLPTRDAPFWSPSQTRGMGFVTADRKQSRWFSLLELSPHVEPTAWDQRNLLTRVNVDVRRDFLQAMASLDRTGGSVGIPGEPPLDLIRDRLSRLKEAIDGFAELLESKGDDPEATFHDYLESHPVLLDAYGLAVSKPQFRYPEGESPLGKTHVEPDFVVQYPGRRYRLVELERPSKLLASKRGEPRVGVTQAAFQIAEWKDFINHHYETLRDRFPGISSSPQSMVVIGRASPLLQGAADAPRYLALLREQLAVDEVITYDDLLERARMVYVQIAGLEMSPTD